MVCQNPQGQDNLLPPPRTLLMDFTMTHVSFGRSHLHPIGHLTHKRRSDGAPDPDGALKQTARIKIRHYRNICLNRPDIQTQQASSLVNELPEESDQFRFLHSACLANLKGSVGLILTKSSAMRISIPLDLSSRPLIPLSRFIRSRSPTPFLAHSLVRWQI